MKSLFCPLLLLLGMACRAFGQESRVVWLDTLKLMSFSEGISAVSPNSNAGGDPLQMGGIRFQRGVGMSSLSVLPFLLEGRAEKFLATVGVDDQARPDARFTFFVIGDQKILFQSPEMHPGDPPEKVEVDLTGIQRLGLLALPRERRIPKSYADWTDARLVLKGDQMPRPIPNDDEKYILTPASPQRPQIHSPKVFGARPGHPFLFALAATGLRPMTFAATGLPEGLTLDPHPGVITGKVAIPGDYPVRITATNSFGQTSSELRIRIGETIALTPPLGWNGWNSWARSIDRQKVMDSARAMVNSGLRNHGWTYVNLDDAWQGPRGGRWNALQPNSHFPDFQQMVDALHDMGLKVGLYSTPWIVSYAGYPGGSSDFENGAFPEFIRDNKRAYRRVGKYRFETNDARQMAEWGVDYLKYDWRIEAPSARRMADALRQSGRDIVYSLSNAAPLDQASEWASIANLYRTGPDIRDSWLSLYYSAFTLDPWGPYAGPGHWNDPDMMVLGKVTTGSEMHPTRLTPDEQYSEVSLFCLLSAPLLIGCPVEPLDPFTLNLLSNDEVIEVDQDPSGRAARLVSDEKGVQTWLKPLQDGSYAVGLFNTDHYGQTPQSFFRWGDEPARPYKLDFRPLHLKGDWKLRDLWRQQDLGIFSNSFDARIPHHGVILLRLVSVTGQASSRK